MSRQIIAATGAAPVGQRVLARDRRRHPLRSSPSSASFASGIGSAVACLAASCRLEAKHIPALDGQIEVPPSFLLSMIKVIIPNRKWEVSRRGADLCVATLRGSFDTFSDRKAAQMMSALRQADQIVLDCLMVEEKSKQIPAVSELIEALGPKGCVFMLDAEHAHGKVRDRERSRAKLNLSAWRYSSAVGRSVSIARRRPVGGRPISGRGVDRGRRSRSGSDGSANERSDCNARYDASSHRAAARPPATMPATIIAATIAVSPSVGGSRRADGQGCNCGQSGRQHKFANHR
jgi:hypothetical protein